MVSLEIYNSSKELTFKEEFPKVLDTNQFLSFITECTVQTNAAFLPLLAKNMEPSKPSSEAFSELMELLEMRLRFSPFKEDSEFQSNAECKSSLHSDQSCSQMKMGTHLYESVI